jgi:hypothetical protein
MLSDFHSKKTPTVNTFDSYTILTQLHQHKNYHQTAVRLTKLATSIILSSTGCVQSTVNFREIFFFFWPLAFICCCFLGFLATAG